MRTFEEWLLDEGLMKNLALGAALAGGAMGCDGGSCEAPKKSFSQRVQDHRNSDTYGDSLGKPKGREVRHKRQQRQQRQQRLQRQQIQDVGRSSSQGKTLQNKSITSPDAGRFLK